MTNAIDWNEIRDRAHAMAIEKGWHETKRTDDEMRMLLITEIAEAFETLRDGRDVRATWCQCSPARDCGRDECKPEGFSIELADVAIRACDWAGAMGIDMDERSVFARLAAGTPAASWLLEIVMFVADNLLIDAVPDSAVSLAEWCAADLGIDLAAAVERKMRHNATRAHRHGGEAL